MLVRSNQAQIQLTLLRIDALYGTGLSLQKCCKIVGISVHTYYKWRRDSSIAAKNVMNTSEG